VLGIEQQGATANITHSTGTLTLGASGFTQTAANNRNWAESGVLAIGAVDQTWSLAFPTVSPATSALSIGGAAGLTGTGILSLANNSGTSDPLRAIMTVAGANAGFTGTLSLLTNSCINFNAVGCLTGCNIEVNGNGAYLRNVGAHSFGAAGKTLTFNANGKMGNTAGVMTCNSPVGLSATQRAITFVNDVTFAAALSGTAGVSMLKSDTAWCDVGFQSLSPSLTTTNGAISIGNYIAAQFYPASWFFSGARNFEVDGIFICGAANTAGFTSPQALPAGTQFTGSGAVGVQFNSTNLVTFPAGALIGLTGDLDPATTFSTALGNQNYARSGLCLNVVPFYARGRSCNVAVNDLPVRLGFRGASNGAGDFGVNRLFYVGPGATYTNTQIDVIAAISDPDAPNASHEIYANCSDSAPLVIGRGIKRLGVSTTQQMTLRGTSTADNEIQGPINPNGLGTLNIIKSDAGKWVLSGNNTYTGATTISAGILGARSASAFGGSTNTITLTSPAQIELSGNISLLKRASLVLHANNPIYSASGSDNTFQCGQLTLASTVTLNTPVNSALRIQNNAAIIGTGFGITKTGAGELQLGDFANTYDGNVSIQAGTLTVTTLNDSGVAGVLGRSTAGLALRSTLRFAGSVAASSTRALALQGATPTLEATGTAAATYSGTITQTAEARQVVLTGTSTAANALASALGDNSLATGIQKTGTGNWRVTGAMSYTGATDVDQGTLRFERPDGNTMASTVTVDAGAFLELATDTIASSGATAGRVLGTGNVVVNGIVKTRGGTTQKGQVRYGGSVVFNAGSSLYIGAAA
jgi:autotransporter-associated beta strand protein